MDELTNISDNEEKARKRLKLNEPLSSDDAVNITVLEDAADLDASENVLQLADSDDEELPSTSDPYVKHFEYSLPEGLATEKLQYQQPKQCEFPEIGNAVYCKPSEFTTEDPNLSRKDISEFHLKKNLLTALQQSSKELSPFQLNFLSLISDYYDITYMHRTHTKGDALRKIYTLHILNHILKSRAKIIHHNSKLAKNPDEEYRDQGFTRPAAVVLVPFRHDCFRIVHHLMSLLPESVVMNKKRFEKEYGPPPRRHRMKKKPQDYEETFEGNIDEDFKIGLRIKNKSVTLYSEFYKSDLIIASPLGLRQIVGAEGDKDRDFDFLSSVEILILDRVDILYLQNLIHLMHVLKHFNLLPKESHGCNFFRVRMYALDGMAKFYRQNIIISSVEHRWFESVLLQNFCFNHKGYLSSITKVKTLGINQIFDTVKMCFRMFDFSDPGLEFDERYKFFINKVLPDFKDPEMAQTLIYIPSYFDFVRLRNYFRENELSAVMICEYSNTGKVAEARNNFFKGRRHFLLYTERAHFYNRYNIKGIQHILFYQPPTYPVFFREMNFAFLDSNPRRKHEEKSCTIIASKFDALQLKYLVGLNEMKRMLTSENKVFVKYIQG